MTLRRLQARLAPAVAAVAVFAAAGCSSTDPPPARPLDVPPVLQRAPGWCAPASLARCLAMEGFDIDQAELARRGRCTPDEGADMAEFCSALELFLALRGLRLVPVFQLDAAGALALAARYDEEAAALGIPPLDRAPGETGGAVVLDELFASAQLLPMRRASAPSLPAFRRAAARALAQGRPALWGVVLGIVPEPGPTGRAMRGGHVRLLTGYDRAGRRVFYSDPWTKDGGTKEMSEEDAIAITMEIWALRETGTGPLVPGKPERPAESVR